MTGGPNQESEPATHQLAAIEIARRIAVTDDVDLRIALAALAQLSVANAALPDLLRDVALFTMLAIPGADGAGLTLLEHGKSSTIVVSSDFVQRVDDIQYTLGEGPCVTAVAEARTVRSGSLGEDPAWPRFGRRVARLGVHSSLSVPLIVGAEVVGGINIYAHDRDAFDQDAAEHAELYAVPAAISVQTAHSLAHTRAVAEQLEKALTSRAVIDQAIGILIARSGCTDTQAFDTLRTISQNENTPLREVARNLRDTAARRARAGHDRPLADVKPADGRG